MKAEKMNFWVPLEIKKSGKDKKGKDYIEVEGVASTEDEDSDGEMLDPDGFDISEMTRYGMLNFNHNQKEILGHITKANIKDRKLFIKGVLYPELEDVQKLVTINEVLEKHGSPRKLGFSVEGKAISRSPLNNKVVTKARLHSAALTWHPKNRNTWASIIKGETDQLWIDEEYDTIEKSHEANGGSQYIIDIVNPENGMRYMIAKDFSIKVEKAMTTESSAKGLIKEDVEKDVKNLISSDKNIQKAIVVLAAAKKQGLLSNSLLEKAHKYIRKIFKDGKWDYIYEETKFIPKKEDLKQSKKDLNSLKEESSRLQSELNELRNKFELEFKNSGERGSNLDKSQIIYRVALEKFLSQKKELKDKYSEISENNKEIFKKEHEVNYDKLPQGEIHNVLWTATKNFGNFNKDNKLWVELRTVKQDISKDDYYIGTDTVFDKVDLEGKSIDEKWDELKKLGKFEQSPKSSSEYIVTDEGVYRKADHWGRCASCYWDFNGGGDGFVENIGFSPFSRFKTNGLTGGYHILNPEFISKAPELLNEALDNIDSIKESFKLNKTQNSVIESKIKEYKDYLAKITDLTKDYNFD